MDKDGPFEAALEQGQLLLETAFGKTRPQIVFNRDITIPVCRPSLNRAVTQITVLPSSMFPSRVCHDHTVVVFFAS